LKQVAIGDLPRLKTDTSVPFTLCLDCAGGTSQRWECLTLLRVLPGRRLVARARSASGGGAGEVLLKLFYGPSHERYCRRERIGLERLGRAGIPVPTVIDGIAAPGVRGLVIGILPDARPIVDSDQHAMETVAGYFGRLHAAGILQTDMHLGNFVASGGTIYAVDGDGVRESRRVRSGGAGLDNLALLAAQRAPRHDDGLAGLLAAYVRARGGEAPTSDGFRRRLDRARRTRMRRYLGKTRRDCSEFVVRAERNRTAYAVRGIGEALIRRWLGASTDDTFASSETLKAGNSATVVRTALPDAVVIKRYNVKSALHRLRRMLRRHPRYRRAWMYGQLLHLLEIPTARPLALVEERHFGVRGLAYLVQANLSGPSLAEEVARSGLSQARCEEVAQLFAMLETAGLTHGDAKASNFLVHQDRIHLIDLDAMRIDPSRVGADRQRFLENWKGDERRRFHAAFVDAGLV
jgi:tRNA A-37 threonylcarbamoyl transferase component Bud32